MFSNEQPASAMIHTHFLRNGEQLSFRPLDSSFCPREFARMVANEADSTRFSDIVGEDGGAAMQFLNWRFTDWPITVGIFNANDDLTAIGFATPINYKPGSRKISIGDIGVNLTYAVARQHEGKGLGTLAICLAIDAAAQKWAHITGLANIQTKASNLASRGLAKKLRIDHVADADFTVKHSDGRSVEYVGFRGPWLDTVQTARQHLNNLQLNSKNQDDDLPAEELLLETPFSGQS